MKTIGRFMLAAAACMSMAAPAAAQRGGRQAGGPPPARPRAAMLQEINRRILNQARNQLGLTPTQLPRFQRVVAGYGQKRSTLEAEERELQAALRDQLRPGVAGNPDSISKLLAGIDANHAKHSATFADENRDLEPVLTPVQRGQWQVIRDRWLQQVRILQQQRPVSDSIPQP